MDQYDYNLGKNTKMVLDFSEDDRQVPNKFEEQKQIQNDRSQYGMQPNANKSSSPIPSKAPGQGGAGAGAAAGSNIRNRSGNPNIVK